MGGDGADNDEYRLAPSDPEARRPGPFLPGKPFDDLTGGTDRPDDAAASPPLDERRFQFSLAELLGLTAGTALLLSLIFSLPGGRNAKIFAGIMGLLVLGGQIVIEGFAIRRPIIRLAWWAALAVYLAACVGALMTG